MIYDIENLKSNSECDTQAWIDNVIMPLISDLSSLSNQRVEWFGPFGLRCEVLIKIAGVGYLRLTQNNEGYTEYDVRYAEGYHNPNGTIAELNGFYNKTALLPDTSEEVYALFLDKAS